MHPAVRIPAGPLVGWAKPPCEAQHPTGGASSVGLREFAQPNLRFMIASRLLGMKLE